MIPHLDETPTLALLDGRYQLHERVGEGGMAHVYRAEDVLLSRTVAIKMMRTDADVLAASSRTRNEVNALATVNHPSLVTLLDARIEPGQHRYLVMEFVEGPTLAVRLREGPLPEREVAHLAEELAAGLHAVHESGLLHRDIKPSNVLLAPPVGPGVPFHVKLADFGLAQVIGAESVTTPGVVLGTAAYLSPEQVRGHGSSPASDIYALGLVLLEAFTGERPFGHTSGIGAVLARLLESPTIPEDLPPEWAALLESMTSLDPELRPTALEVVRRVATIPAGSTARRSLPSRPRETETPQTQPLPQATRVPAGRHVAPRKRRPAVRPSRTWVRRAAFASSAAVAALIALFTAFLVGAPTAARPEVVGVPAAPSGANPFALVRDDPDAAADHSDMYAIDLIEVPAEPIEETRSAQDRSAQDRPAQGSSAQETVGADRSAVPAANALAVNDSSKTEPDHQTAAEREAAKQAAAAEREAAKQAAADERAADKAAREAERAAEKDQRDADHARDKAAKQQES